MLWGAVFVVLAAFGSSSWAQGVSGCYSYCEAVPSTDPGKLWYQTADTTVLNPFILVQASPVVITPPGSSMYLLPTSCLGYYGPVGPWGPLGLLGPVGNNTWNPSYWISGGFASWDMWADWCMLDGPLGLGGPLSDAGPLTYQSIYCSLPCMNDYSHHLLPAGIWGVLGPFGPTGPLGPLGPLGPVGAHGYLANQNGQYVDVDGNVHRTVDAPYNETYNRTFELYEFYTQPFAASFKDQDTSFMVEGTYDSSHPERSTYPFTSKQEQVVIITVVPINQLNSYAFSATGGSFNVTNSLSALSYISWAQLRAKQGEQFTVKVWLNAAFGLVYGYRLYVVGSTSEFVNTDVTGPQRIFV